MTYYQKGQSGNPDGRPKGAQNKRTLLIKLFEENANDLISKAISLAKNGDTNMLRFCLERIVPRVKSETLTISLPEIDMSKPDSVVLFGAEILRAVTNMEISPEQGRLLTEIVEAQRKNIETHEIAKRLAEMERGLKLRQFGVKKTCLK